MEKRVRQVILQLRDVPGQETVYSAKVKFYTIYGTLMGATVGLILAIKMI